MFAILSTDQKSLRTSNKREVIFQEGDYGWVADETKRIGKVNDARKLPSSERAVFGIYEIKPVAFNKKREKISNTGYEKTAAGKIKITADQVIATATIAEISPTTEIRALRARVDARKMEVQSGGMVFTHDSVRYVISTDGDAKTDLAGVVSVVNEGGWDDLTNYWTVKQIVTVGEVDYLGPTVDLILTGVEFKAIALLVGQHIIQAHGVARWHKKQIDALPVTWEAYDGYNFEAGWPDPVPHQEAPG